MELPRADLEYFDEAIFLVIVGVSMLMIGSAQPAPYETGNSLLARCQGDYYDEALCLGYLEGVADTSGWLRNAIGLASCVPAGVSVRQLKDVVVNALIAAPADRNMNADVLVTTAVIRAWRCTLAMPQPAPYFMTGNSLLAMCQAGYGDEALSLCLGYLGGSTDSFWTFCDAKAMCQALGKPVIDQLRGYYGLALSLCLGDLKGFTDIFGTFRDAKGLSPCVPVGVTAGQLKDVVVNALMAHPADRNMNAVGLVNRAITDAWHCL
jgi:hypothetical protein